ncbi:MAG: 50S ribosomal protein L15e [Candidatus Marsarchaeota archaeon]|nr:50S ribosomal protein L15e [Candidatus Marsarchaeota archaeon]
MGAYKYIKENFQKGYGERSDLLRRRVSAWRKAGAVVRLDGPTNLARARELGYRAKPGVIVARVKTIKGMSKRIKPRGGRKPSKSGRFFSYAKSLQSVAEDRASRKYMNAEVLNSYYIGEDGKYRFFEVMLLDRAHPAISGDAIYSGITGSKGRSFRGLTSSGVKHRGMGGKGKGFANNRPSVRSAHRGVKVI